MKKVPDFNREFPVTNRDDIKNWSGEIPKINKDELGFSKQVVEDIKNCSTEFNEELFISKWETMATDTLQSIKASELRIGNAVHFEAVNDEMTARGNGFISYLKDDVCGVILNQNRITLSYKYIRPIELTTEILEKCGFKNNHTELVLSMPEGYFSAPLTGEYVVFGLEVADLFYDAHQSDIKYLHQLQNLYFSLTGEELPIQF